MSRIKEKLKRPARVAGLLPLVWARAHLDDLEVDLAECRRHERLLEAEVARIEAGVARIARRRSAGRDEDHLST